MSQLTFTTLTGSWTADGQTFAGEVTVDDASPGLVRLAGSAHAAGAIEVSEGLDMSHVESDEDSLKALEAAMGDWVDAERHPDTGEVLEPGYWTGPWHEGNLAAQETTAIGPGEAEVVVDVEGDES